MKGAPPPQIHGPFVEIARRLASVRRAAGLSQKDLAYRVGLSRDQLATVEQGRTPLRVWPGWEMCRELNINQVWLITGSGPAHPFLDLDLDSVKVALEERSLLYEICTSLLRERLSRLSITLAPINPAKSLTRRVTRTCLIQFPPEYARQRIARLRSQAEALLREADSLAEQVETSEELRDERIHLPTVTLERNVSSMTEMQDVIARLRKITMQRGKKAELSIHLGVAKARVSEWLRKEKSVSPSGETTLKMLRWVEQQERQQNTLGSGINTAKGKTQACKSSNEKQTQVR